MSALLSERQAQLADRWHDAKVDRLARLQRFKNCRTCTWAQHLERLPATRLDPPEDEAFICAIPDKGSITGEELDELIAKEQWYCERWEAKGEGHD